MREVITAFLSQGKVLLDLLAKAVASALGNPGGFKEKHGNLALRLEEFASAVGAPEPSAKLVERARELERDLADVRDDLLVHPKRRDFVHASGADLEIVTMFPNDAAAKERRVLVTDEVAAKIDAYIRDLFAWLREALRSAA